jgi:hypothetical protein
MGSVVIVSVAYVFSFWVLGVLGYQVILEPGCWPVPYTLVVIRGNTYVLGEMKFNRRL